MIRFIPDEKLARIKIVDNGEKLVALKSVCPHILIRIDPESRMLQNFKRDECYVRVSVAKKLCRVAKMLPEGIKLVVLDGYRSIEAQRRMHDNLLRKLRKKHPNWSEKKLLRITDMYIANPDKITFHSTGGAVDVTLADSKGRELEMGTELDSFTAKSALDSRAISKTARKNRQILKNCMRAEGFVNYPLEWWHWSYGDAYWAAKLGKKHAIYGPVNLR
ncbi:MAG: M15 family metallopeptidase [Candidatus Woesearchaeota archaeon]